VSSKLSTARMTSTDDGVVIAPSKRQRRNAIKPNSVESDLLREFVITHQLTEAHILDESKSVTNNIHVEHCESKLTHKEVPDSKGGGHHFESKVDVNERCISHSGKKRRREFKPESIETVDEVDEDKEESKKADTELETRNRAELAVEADEDSKSADSTSDSQAD
jgi:hypothetical protein